MKRSMAALLWAAFLLPANTMAEDFTLPAVGNSGALLSDTFVQKRFYNVGNDHGGIVTDYAVKVEVLRNDKAIVRFDGECDSACTLFLSLPSCVTPQSRFGFHQPRGSSPHEVLKVRQYMWQQYPVWVQEYLLSYGWPQSGVRHMPYEYAKEFLPTC